MKDEIKETLDLIRELVEQSPNRGFYGITHKKWKQLLDYITNLQEDLEKVSGSHFEIFQENKMLKEENKKLKEICDKYEEEHGTAFEEWKKVFDLRGEKLLLQEENERLIKLKERYQLEKEVYKSRNEKAIEYFKCQLEQLDFYEDTKAKMLCAMGIVILQGEDKK